MALIAKKKLVHGFTVVALPGTAVSANAVKEYGWENDVEDDGSDAKKKTTKKAAAEA